MRSYLRVLTIFIFVIFFTVKPAYAEEISRIIATVNNQAITSGDLESYCTAMAFKLDDGRGQVSCSDANFKKQALDRLIEDNLVLDEAKREDTVVSQRLVEERLASVVSSYSSREAFKESLLEKGLTIGTLKIKIEEQYLMRAIMEKNVQSLVRIFPREISEYYGQNKEAFLSDTTYIFYVAKSESRQDVRRIASQIKNDDIGEAVQKNKKIFVKVKSEKDELKDDILRIIESLKEGEYAIRKVSDLHYLIYLEKVVEPRVFSLEETKEQIYAYLGKLKFRERFTIWISKLKEKAVINKYHE